MSKIKEELQVDLTWVIGLIRGYETDAAARKNYRDAENYDNLADKLAEIVNTEYENKKECKA